MKRLLIDMDDVLADASGQFVKYFNQRNDRGLTLSREQLRGSNWAKAADIHQDTVRSWLLEPGFFGTMPLMPDAVEVVRELHRHYEIFIVSAAIEFPFSLKEKVDWLAEHFPFINWRYIVLCGHKHMIEADFLIDDHEKNLVHFSGTPLLFDAPHNTAITGYERLLSWPHARQRLLP